MRALQVEREGDAIPNRGARYCNFQLALWTMRSTDPSRRKRVTINTSSKYIPLLCVQGEVNP